MKLNEQAALLNIQEKHGAFVKGFNGYDVQLTMRRSFNGIGKMTCLSFVFDREITKTDRKAILKAQGVLKGYVLFDSVGLKNNTVFIFINLNKRHVDKVETKITKMTSTFKSLGLHNLSTCPFCKQEEPTDGYRVINGVLIDVHQACVTSYVAEAEKDISSQEQSKGMFKSLIYAFVGAIFGVIPAMIALLQFNYFIGWLFVLIPLASFYFYKFGKGPKTIQVLVIIVLMSLLLVPAIMLFIYSNFAGAYGYTLSEAILIDDVFATEFYSNLGLSFLFSVIGIAISWHYIYRQSTAVAKKKLNEYRK